MYWCCEVIHHLCNARYFSAFVYIEWVLIIESEQYCSFFAFVLEYLFSLKMLKVCDNWLGSFIFLGVKSVNTVKGDFVDYPSAA